MTLHQRIAAAAAALAIGGGAVLMAVTGTAGAAAPQQGPTSTAVGTVPVAGAPGHRGIVTTGPMPTATVGVTSGSTSRTPSPGTCGSGDQTSGESPRTVTVTPGASIPAVKSTDDAQLPTATAAATR